MQRSTPVIASCSVLMFIMKTGFFYLFAWFYFKTQKVKLWACLILDPWVFFFKATLTHSCSTAFGIKMSAVNISANHWMHSQLCMSEATPEVTDRRSRKPKKKYFTCRALEKRNSGHLKWNTSRGVEVKERRSLTQQQKVTLEWKKEWLAVEIVYFKVSTIKMWIK